MNSFRQVSSGMSSRAEVLRTVRVSQEEDKIQRSSASLGGFSRVDAGLG